MKRFSHTSIEYANSPDGSKGYGWNFISGCRHKEQGKCPPVPCWAAEFVPRFKNRYPNGFAPTFYPEAFLSPLALKKPSRILVCFMGDLFGDWMDSTKEYQEEKIRQYIKGDWIYRTIRTTDEYMGGKKLQYTLHEIIFRVIEARPQNTFVFLTKNPTGMRRWGKFPDNCEVGASSTDTRSALDDCMALNDVSAKIRWLSLEPLLNSINLPAQFLKDMGIDWVAIGALTGTKKQMLDLAPRYPALTPWKLSAKGNRWGLMPPVAWLKNIVENCDKAGMKVFLKDNLNTWLMEIPHDDLFWEDMSHLRQEYGAREVFSPSIIGKE